MATMSVTKARLKLVKKQTPSRIEDGPAILNYKGPRVPVAQMHGGVGMKKVSKRARR
jgi:hypothetical protein